jgi:hypothetical protein
MARRGPKFNDVSAGSNKPPRLLDRGSRFKKLAAIRKRIARSIENAN